jgi:hypothetical protein
MPCPSYLPWLGHFNYSWWLDRVTLQIGIIQVAYKRNWASCLIWQCFLLALRCLVHISAGTPIILIKVFLVFLSLSRQVPGYWLPVRPWLLAFMSFPIHHPGIWYYMVIYWLLLNKLQINKQTAHRSASDLGTLHYVGIILRMVTCCVSFQCFMWIRRSM